MLRLATDIDVHGDIIRGLLRREPDLDLERLQEVALDKTPDPEVLEWAAEDGRVLITQDRKTLVGFAYARVKAGQPMPGVLALRKKCGIGEAIEDILLVAKCYTASEMNDQVLYIPLK
jgi:hypothetical protein